MEKVFVVVHTAGSYSDWSMENICAFLYHNDAETECEKRNDQLARFKKAQADLYKHMNAWSKDNPRPMLSDEERRDLQRLKYSTSAKNRTAKQNKRLQALEEINETVENDAKMWSEMRLDEERDFIQSRDYLHDDDKTLLTDRNNPRYYDNDGEYHVEVLELRG